MLVAFDGMSSRVCVCICVCKCVCVCVCVYVYVCLCVYEQGVALVLGRGENGVANEFARGGGERRKGRGGCQDGRGGGEGGDLELLLGMYKRGLAR